MNVCTQFEGQRYDAKAAFRSIADEWASTVSGKKRESINTVVQVCISVTCMHACTCVRQECMMEWFICIDLICTHACMHAKPESIIT